MGVLAEFFISDHETATQLEDTQSLPQSDIAQYKRFTDLEIGYLDQILAGRPITFEEESMMEIVSIFDDGERVTTMFSKLQADRLAGITDSELHCIASKWGECEELSCSGEELEPVIVDLRRLASAAKDRNLGLYLWNCV